MILNDEPAFLAWFLAALRSGVIAVPLSTMLTADDLGTIVNDAEASIVVVSDCYAAHVPQIARLAPPTLWPAAVAPPTRKSGVEVNRPLRSGRTALNVGR